MSGLHSWGSLTLLIALASLAYFLIRSPPLRRSVQIRTWAVSDATLFMVAGGAEIVTALLYSGHFAGGTLEIGFFLELLGGALTALGGLASRRLAGDVPRIGETVATTVAMADSLPPWVDRVGWNERGKGARSARPDHESE